MNKENVKKFIGDMDMNIVDAMGMIDANAKGILFIVNKKGELVGCITDGDIRRWIINAGDLTALVSDVMIKHPRFLYREERGQAGELMQKQKITALPILHKNGKIHDIVLLSDVVEQKVKKLRDNLSEVPVVIMAGGKGTRLFPFTKILPKPLIPIGETPIIERIINYFTEYSIDKFYMTVNYKKGMIRSYFSDVEPEYIINYVEEEKPLGTGGSIKLIEEKFEKPVIVTNCDALILADYGDIYKFHKNSGNKITMVSAIKNITIPYGVIKSGENGEVLEIEEKPKLSYFINTGMYVIDPDTIELIPDNELFHMTDLIDKVMKNGGKVGTYPISEDSFLDMGEFSEMHRMEEKLKIVSEE